MPPASTNLFPDTLSAPELNTNTRALADNCNTITELREAVENFKELTICKTATNTVFADGNAQGGIMIIGEAPGANEDAQGIPFCGISGQLLDRMFAAIGMNRQQHLYISNTVFWRPPNNRPPTEQEQAVCLPFVQKHIALAQPKLLILAGGSATKALLDPHLGITKLRGRLHEYRNNYMGNAVTTAVLFHPSYLLRNPAQKRLAWEDLLEIRQYAEAQGIL
jgi:DNA polymerase